MVVLDPANPDSILGLTVNYFQNQAPLVVEPNRPLVDPLTFQFLKMQGLEGVQIALIIGGTKLLHSPPVCPDNRLPKASLKIGIGF